MINEVDALKEKIKVLEEENRRLSKTEKILKESKDNYKSLYRMMRLMCDNVPDMIWAKDKNNRYLFTNKAICDNLLNAKNTSEPIGKDDIYFARRERAKYPENKAWHSFGEICIDSDEIIAQLKKPKRFDEYGNVKGKFLYLDVHKAPFWDEKDNFIGTVGCGRDVTKEKQIENERNEALKALQYSEERFRQLAEMLPEMVFEITIEGKITFYNKAALKKLGYTGCEIKNRDVFIYDILDREQKRRLKATLRKIRHGKSMTGNQYRLKRRDGSVFYVEVYSSPIIIQDNIVGFRGLAVDVTPRIRATAELIKAKEAAEKADHLKSAFLANMSHEIRTPMNSILGFSQLLNKKRLSEEKRAQYHSIIQTNGKALLNLLDDIIDISKIESDQITVLKSAFNLNQLLDELYTLYSYTIDKMAGRDITFKLQKAWKDDESFFYSDRERLQQVLNNLLGNAFKFTKNGCIEFGYEKISDKFIRFFIKDSGIGLDPEKIEIVFNRFQQADNSITREFGGTGLGLAISKGLVEKLGGNIWVDSEPGKGAVFYFTLPNEVTDLKEIHHDENIIADNDPDWRNKTLLLVEDNQANMLYFSELLAESKINIVTASNGRDAVHKCKDSDNIDIVLLDVKLPDISGYEVVRKIKMRWPDLPVIAQTALSMVEDKNKCFDAGYDAYLPKPFGREELYLVLAKYI